MKPSASESIAIAPRIIRINDTRHYNIAGPDQEFIESIHSVYLYDSNSRTYCCEITPSYYLIYLYTDVDFINDPDDDIRERLYDKYGDNNGENTYMHCSDLDKIEKDHLANDTAKHEGFYVQWFGDFYIAKDVIVEQDETRDEVMESLRETYTCNHVI